MRGRNGTARTSPRRAMRSVRTARPLPHQPHQLMLPVHVAQAGGRVASRPAMRTTPRALALAFAAGLAVAACGGGASGSGSTPTAPASPDLTVHAEEIKFDQKAYTVHGGEVK